MNLKIIIYMFSTIITVLALDSININTIFKKNKIYQARLLVLFLAMSLSYLVANFLIDVFMYSSFI